MVDRIIVAAWHETLCNDHDDMGMLRYVDANRDPTGRLLRLNFLYRMTLGAASWKFDSSLAAIERNHPPLAAMSEEQRARYTEEFYNAFEDCILQAMTPKEFDRIVSQYAALKAANPHGLCRNALDAIRHVGQARGHHKALVSQGYKHDITETLRQAGYADVFRHDDIFANALIPGDAKNFLGRRYMGPRNGKGPKERLEAVENLAGIYKVRMGDVVFMGADAELDHDVFDAVGRVVVSPFADLEKSREIARLYNRNGKVRRPADNFNQIHNAIIAP